MGTRQCFRFLDFTRVVQEIKLEELLRLLYHFLRSIEALRVHLEHSCCIDCQRTVHINRDRWNRALARQTMQGIDHFLRSTDGESRNEDSATTSSGLSNTLSELSSRSFHRLMVTVPVSRFHDQRVGIFGWSRIADNRQTTPADVPGKDQPFRPTRLCAIQHHRG